jgi:hypothetical protein
MTKPVESLLLKYEAWIPWIIAVVVTLIVFPYQRVKEYFTPEPITIVEYIEVPVKEYVYIEPPTPTVPPPPPKPKEPIVCVFDVNALTAGDPTRCIKMCKDMGCVLAINTNRDIATPHDLDLETLGMVEPNFIEEDYYFNPNAKTSTFDEVAGTKVANMDIIRNKYNITDPKRLILFEDNKINIEKVKEGGYSVVQVGTKNPGVQEDDIKKAYELIRSL